MMFVPVIVTWSAGAPEAGLNDVMTGVVAPRPTYSSTSPCAPPLPSILIRYVVPDVTGTVRRL